MVINITGFDTTHNPTTFVAVTRLMKVSVQSQAYLTGKSTPTEPNVHTHIYIYIILCIGLTELPLRSLTLERGLHPTVLWDYSIDAHQTVFTTIHTDQIIRLSW